MSKVIVVTDSNSGITPDDAKKLGVEVIPMPFYIDEQMYYENIDLTQEQFYEKLTAGGDIKTSMPLVGDVTVPFPFLSLRYKSFISLHPSMLILISSIDLSTLNASSVCVQPLVVIPYESSPFKFLLTIFCIYKIALQFKSGSPP